MLLTTAYFLLALLVLIIVHEYGHFQVARWCGVKVLRFSFGFGKVLARWTDKKGTEYTWSLWPLGGYVKMLGEGGQAVPAAFKDQSFNHKPLHLRMAIVLAGPLFNFIFAFFALWLIAVIGVYSLAPVIHSVDPNSIAGKAAVSANQELIDFNGKTIKSWRDFQLAIMPYVGSHETVSLGLKSLQDGHYSQIRLPLSDWTLDYKNPDLLKSLGIEPFIPNIPPIIGEILPNTPAAKSNLLRGDKIRRVDGKAINDWLSLVKYVKSRPNTQIQLEIERAQQVYQIPIQTGQKKNPKKPEGFLGLHSEKVEWPAAWLRLEREGPLSALKTAFKQTLELTHSTFTLIGRLVNGQLGIKSISGPLGIAQGAGHSGRNGFISYLFFLSVVSISLGAINLLPIPLLDGGHLLYYVLELIFRKPVPQGIKNINMYFGIILLAAVMLVAFTNDISRLLD